MRTVGRVDRPSSALGTLTGGRASVPMVGRAGGLAGRVNADGRADERRDGPSGAIVVRTYTYGEVWPREEILQDSLLGHTSGH